MRVQEGWFQDLWDKADVQTVEDVAVLMEKLKAQKEAKKRPSRSPSAQRQPRRQAARRFSTAAARERMSCVRCRLCRSRRCPRLGGPLEQPAKALFHEPLSGSVSHSAPSM